MAGENPYFNEALLPHIETLAIPHEMIFQEVLTKGGAPSQPELSTSLDELSSQLGVLSKIKDYINETDDSQVREFVSRANLSLKVKRDIAEAYAYLKEAYGALL